MQHLDLTPAYSLDYRPQLHLLVLRWLQDPNLAASQPVYQRLLGHAQALGCAAWLLDVRRRGPVVPDASAWLAQEFFPAAAAALAPRPLHLAVLNSPTRNVQLHADPAIEASYRHALAPERPYQLRVFTDEGEATQWLHANTHPG